MTIEQTPEDIPSLAAAVVGLGMVAAIIGVLVFFPVIDRFIRARYRLSRGQAMSLLLGAAFVCWGIGSTLAYLQLHDDPRFDRPDETEKEEATNPPNN